MKYVWFYFSQQVPLCEENPFEATKTNVGGTQNLITAAIKERIEKFMLISTDKAVNPVNVMGATKLLAEQLTISANSESKTAFSCVRFGNVLESRGSVIPLFRSQIKTGKMITLTDPNMTRFIMSIPKAVNLVLDSTAKAKGGEVFILKMPTIIIGELANTIIEESAKNIQI
ncbi:unnamed protein product, partial [marine sediment metagenome]